MDSDKVLLAAVDSTDLATAYFPILLFLVVAIIVACAAVGLSFLIGKQKPDAEKNSAYECGFAAFSDARHRFDVRFYLVAILYPVRGSQAGFLFPWAVSLGALGWAGFWAVMLFLGVLTVGFAYEWKKGALEWE